MTGGKRMYSRGMYRLSPNICSYRQNDILKNHFVISSIKKSENTPNGCKENVPTWGPIGRDLDGHAPRPSVTCHSYMQTKKIFIRTQTFS